MSKCTRWCQNVKCQRKKVIHFPLSIFEKDYKRFKNKPFKCLSCEKRFSHKEMDLCVGKSNPRVVYQKDIKSLCQDLRQHCLDVQKRRHDVN